MLSYLFKDETVVVGDRILPVELGFRNWYETLLLIDRCVVNVVVLERDLVHLISVSHMSNKSPKVAIGIVAILHTFSKISLIRFVAW